MRENGREAVSRLAGLALYVLICPELLLDHFQSPVPHQLATEARHYGLYITPVAEFNIHGNCILVFEVSQPRD